MAVRKSARRVTPPTLGRGSVALAVVVVQVVAFAATYLIDWPTLYVPFALLSAALLGWRIEHGVFGAASATFGAVLLLALGLPLALFVARQQPALVVEKLRASEVHKMLLLTIYGPLVAAVVAVAFGVPLAYLLAKGFRGQGIVESLVDLPLVVPHSVAGILILFGFGGEGVFPGLSLLGTLLGMVAVLVFVGAPYAVNAAREGFEAIDPRVVYAARSHGASPFETFRQVTLPLAKRSVLTGGVLTWARGVSEFGAVAVIAYSIDFFVPGAGMIESSHAPVFIYKAYTGGSLADASAVGFILLAMSAIIFLVIRTVAYDGASRGVL